MKKTDLGGMPLPPFRSISTADIHFLKTGYCPFFSGIVLRFDRSQLPALRNLAL